MARLPRSGTSASRSSWRDTATASKSNTSLNRWVATFFLTLLVAILTWLLWPRTLISTHLLVQPVVNYDALALPTSAFIEADSQALQALDTTDNVAISRDADRGDSIRDLAAKLKTSVTDPRDVLVLYITAHGISDQGKPYLALTDFDRNRLSGRYELSQLLEDVSQCQAKTKLVIVDSCRVVTDARLGMFVNEFPRLLEQAVLAQKDKDLWVLAANGPMQTSYVSQSQKRSYFNLAVTSALAGKADYHSYSGNSDGLLTMDELYKYTQDFVGAMVNRPERIVQTPMLYQGGTGYVPELPADDSQRVVLALSMPGDELEAERQKLEAEGEKKEEANNAASPSMSANYLVRSSHFDGARPTSIRFTAFAPPPTDTPEAGKANKENETKEGPSTNKGKGAEVKNSPSDSTDNSGNPPATAANSAAPPPATPEYVLWSLRQAWKIHQRLQQRSNDRPYSPVDFAPHLWRELTSILISYERRSRSAAEMPVTDLSQQLDQIVADLLALEQLMQATDPDKTDRLSSTASSGERLQAAWRIFVTSGGAKSFRQATTQAPQLLKLRHLLNDTITETTALVDWSTEQCILYNDLSSVVSALEPLVQRLDSAQEEFTLWQNTPLDLRTKTAINSEIASLSTLRQKVMSQITAFSQSLLKNAPTPVSFRRMDQLLAHTLISIDLREQLNKAIISAPETDRKWPSPNTSPTSFGPVETAKWQQLAKHARWYELLTRLVMPHESSQLLEKISKITPGSTPDAAWLAVRAIGTDLQQFYGDFPIHSATLSNDKLTNALLLVDSRDAIELNRIVERKNFMAKISWVEPPEKPKLLVSGPSIISLERDQIAEVDFDVLASRLSSKEAQYRLNYDPERIQVDLIQNGRQRSILPSQLQPISLAIDGTTPLRFRVRAKQQIAQATFLEIEVATTAPLLNSRLQVALQLPSPDIVELLVERLGSPERQTFAGNGKLEIFPNRKTSYRWLLVNRTGEKLPVTVEMYALPPDPANPVSVDSLSNPSTLSAVRQRVLNDRGEPYPHIQLLSTTNMELPQDDQPIEIPFGIQNAEQKPVVPSSPSSKVSPTPETDISAGLLLLIRETETSRIRWSKWLEVASRNPRDYLAPEVSYDAKKERIVVLVRPVDLDGDGIPDPGALPYLIGKESVTIHWDLSKQLPAETPGKESASLLPGRMQDMIFAEVPSKPNRVIHLDLDVDGYPRAFAFDVPCDVSHQNIARRTSRRKLDLLSPTPQQAFQANSSDQTSIPIFLRIDAPENAFQQPADFVELRLEDGSGRKMRFHSDRLTRVFFVSTSTTGIVQFRCEVGDLKGPFLKPGVKNTKVKLVATLNLGNEKIEKSAVIVLDGVAPKITSVLPEPSNRIQQGSFLKVVAKAEDSLSGLSQLEFDIDTKGTGILDDATKQLVRQPDIDGNWQATFEIKADLPPGTYTILVRATDRVGLQSRTNRSLRIQVEPPRGKGVELQDKQPTMQVGTISGVVKGPRGGAKGILLTVKGTKLTASSDPLGKFVIKNVPVGPQVIDATGNISGVSAAGSGNCKVRAGETSTVSIQLR